MLFSSTILESLKSDRPLPIRASRFSGALIAASTPASSTVMYRSYKSLRSNLVGVLTAPGWGTISSARNASESSGSSGPSGTTSSVTEPGKGSFGIAAGSTAVTGESTTG